MQFPCLGGMEIKLDVTNPVMIQRAREQLEEAERRAEAIKHRGFHDGTGGRWVFHESSISGNEMPSALWGAWLPVEESLIKSSHHIMNLARVDF